MAKLTYFTQEYGDRDDALHHEAIKRGIVGVKCKLGGDAILPLMEQSPNDICAVCPVEDGYRAVCQGRARKKALPPVDANDEVSYTQNQTAAALRARHERFAASIHRQILDQERKRK